MPRIYSLMYQPYTYQELIAPLQASTEAHKEVEKDYTDTQLLIGSLRQRAENEPNALWALNINNYANQLEKYADDLMRNGLMPNTRLNLMDMKIGFGNNVTPVVNAIAREKELLAIRDKASGTRAVFGRNPTLLEIIDNPNITQSQYSGESVYGMAKDAAAALSARNILIFDPKNYNAYLYKYSKEKGFSNEDILEIMKQDPEFANLFGYIRDQFGYGNDPTMDDDSINKLNNEIVAGALAGFSHDIDVHYGNRPDYLNPLQLVEKKIKDKQLAALDNDTSSNGFRHIPYYQDNGYQNLLNSFNTLGTTIFDNNGNIKQHYLNSNAARDILKQYGINVSTNTDFIDVYNTYIKPLREYLKNPYNYIADRYGSYYETPRTLPRPYLNVTPEQMRQINEAFNNIGYTDEVYDALNSFGINLLSGRNPDATTTNTSDININTLYDLMDSMKQLSRYTEIPITEFDDVDAELHGYISSHKKDKSWSKKVYKVDYNGEFSNDTCDDPEDTGLVKSGEYQKDKIINMQYSVTHPGYIILTIKDSGMIAVPTQFFADELQRLEQAGQYKLTEEYRQMWNEAYPDDLWNSITDSDRIDMQDEISNGIYYHFIDREKPHYGNTISRPKN